MSYNIDELLIEQIHSLKQNVIEAARRHVQTEERQAEIMNAQLQNQMDKQEGENRILQAQTENLRLRSEKEELSKQIETYKYKLKNLEGQVNDLAEKDSQAEIQILINQNNLILQSQANDLAEKDMEIESSKLSKNEMEIKLLQSELKNSQLQNQMDKLVGEIRILQAENLRLLAEKEELSKLIEKYKTELEDLKVPFKVLMEEAVQNKSRLAAEYLEFISRSARNGCTEYLKAIVKNTTSDILTDNEDKEIWAYFHALLNDEKICRRDGASKFLDRFPNLKSMTHYQISVVQSMSTILTPYNHDLINNQLTSLGNYAHFKIQTSFFEIGEAQSSLDSALDFLDKYPTFLLPFTERAQNILTAIKKIVTAADYLVIDRDIGSIAVGNNKSRTYFHKLASDPNVPDYKAASQFVLSSNYEFKSFKAKWF